MEKCSKKWKELNVKTLDCKDLSDFVVFLKLDKDLCIVLRLYNVNLDKDTWSISLLGCYAKNSQTFFENKNNTISNSHIDYIDLQVEYNQTNWDKLIKVPHKTTKEVQFLEFCTYLYFTPRSEYTLSKKYIDGEDYFVLESYDNIFRYKEFEIAKILAIQQQIKNETDIKKEKPDRKPKASSKNKGIGSSNTRKVAKKTRPHQEIESEDEYDPLEDENWLKDVVIKDAHLDEKTVPKYEKLVNYKLDFIHCENISAKCDILAHMVIELEPAIEEQEESMKRIQERIQAITAKLGTIRAEFHEISEKKDMIATVFAKLKQF